MVVLHNQPGKWDVFISYTQQDHHSNSVAAQLHGSLTSAGYTVWLDKRMNNQATKAMEEGMRGSTVALAIVSKTYFERDMCLQEIEWAKQAGKKIIPCTHASAMTSIGDMRNVAPPQAKFLFESQVQRLDDSSPRFWETSVEGIREQLANAGISTRSQAPVVRKKQPGTVVIRVSWNLGDGSNMKDGRSIDSRLKARMAGFAGVSVNYHHVSCTFERDEGEITVTWSDHTGSGNAKDTVVKIVKDFAECHHVMSC